MISVLVEKYYRLLITECEIFLSLIVKFLDPDKPSWQRALALELLHKLVTQPGLVTEFCRYYDCQPHATNIFQDMINSLGAYVQVRFSLFSLLNCFNICLPFVRTCSSLCIRARVRTRVIIVRQEALQPSSPEPVLEFRRGRGRVSAPSPASIIEAASSPWW